MPRRLLSAVEACFTGNRASLGQLVSWDRRSSRTAVRRSSVPSPNLPPGFDFTDPDIYAERIPVEEFAEVRSAAPIWWNEQAPGHGGGFNDGGFWAITKLNDVKEISRRSDVFVTTLINADIDGEKLSDDEFGFFVMMLAVAGNETTRNSITQGMMAFADFPDQWELYKKERPETAADEIVRWASPITSFQRTALEDYELSGVQIKKGQRVVMFYRSANFDEGVFDDPYTFNILRDPNPHVGFGGTGAHYCVGANLARMTIDLMFNAVADNMPDLKPLAKPERLRSGWMTMSSHRGTGLSTAN